MSKSRVGKASSRAGDVENVRIVKFERQIGRSEPILLLETANSRWWRHFELRMEPITGGVVVESKVERVEK